MINNSQESKVSIILPTYNGAKYIRQSIESCLNQTHTSFELIVIDDCSKDETPTIVQSYKDSRVFYFRNEQNQRLPKSLNIGFTKATGDYLTWTSDDNFYTPTAIEKMVNALKEYHCEFVYTDIYTLKDDNINNSEIVRLDNYEKLRIHNCIRACFLYTRKVLKTVGEYDPDTELIEDYDYWVRVSKHFAMHHIEEPFYYYRFHPNSLWCSRFDEIKIIEFLFKLKHGFKNSDEVNWLLRNFMLKKYNQPNMLNRWLIKLKHKDQIQSLLENYQKRQMSFTQTSKELNKMIHGSQKQK